jgi:hypothetical protein
MIRKIVVRAVSLILVGVVPELSGQGLYPNLRTDRFHWENDYRITDRHYTNGLRYSTITSSTEFWRRRAERPVLKTLLLGARACSRFESPMSDGCYYMRTGWTVGQNFYTPNVITNPDPDPADRPYGGWLYFGRMFEFTGERLVLEAEFDVGVIGPLSLSSGVQEGWHNLFGWDHPAGWDHQITHGIGLQAVYRASYELVGLRLDGQYGPLIGTTNISLTPRTQIALGTPITRGNVGATLRIGKGVPIALVPVIIPSVPPPFAPNNPAEASDLTDPLPPPVPAANRPPAPTALELRQEAAAERIAAERPRHASERPAYVFAGGAVNGVLLNDFLQGTHLGDRDANPVIDIEMNHSFIEWEAGATLAMPCVPIIGPADITIRHVWRGAEYQGGPEHRFWALTVAW